jgi:tetratricopeptide (TPR) repeat protein
MDNIISRDSVSRSNLWKSQRAFYKNQGIDAWNCKVPFYITCNPYIASAYADIIMRFIQDYNNNNKLKKDEPIYILEIGIGSGVFSFYLIKSLMELQNQWFGTEQKFVYIMSDLVEQNLDFAENNKGFKQFIDKGVLKFAYFDAENSETIKLRDGSLLPKSNKPMVVVSNYIFDTLFADVFHITTDGIEELQIKQDIDIPEIKSQDISFTLKDLDKDSYYKKVSLPHFKEPALDQVLKYYLDQKQETTMLFPTGSISCLEHLRKINPRLVVLTADKGTITPTHNDVHSFVTHNKCFSTMVDMHALGIYAKNSGGNVFQQETESLVFSTFFIGHNLKDLPETQKALTQSLERFNPCNLYSIFNYASSTRNYATIDAVLNLLKLTSWDPAVFNNFYDVIIANIPYSYPYTINELVTNIPKIAANIFYFPSNTDTYMLIASFLYHLKNYEQALLYYKNSIDIFGPTDNAFYNMGLCYYNLNNKDQAVECMQETVKLNENYILARGWIAHIQFEKEKQMELEKQKELIK